MKCCSIKKIVLFAVLLMAFSLTVFSSATAFALDNEAVTTYGTQISDIGETDTTEENFDEPAVVFIEAPTITSIENSYGGVTVQWKEITGAARYAVYKKTSTTDFTKIYETKKTTCFDKKVSDCTEYSYAIKCLDENGQEISELGAHKSIRYIASPKITKIKNMDKYASVTWNKVKGASKYRLYCLNSENKWEAVGTTASTAFKHKNLKNGVTYTYAVRCLNSKGNCISAINPKGTKNLYLSPIKVSKVSLSKKAHVIKWGKTQTAASYTVYRAALGGNRKKLAEVKTTSYTDKSIKSGVAYQYFIVAKDKKGSDVTYFNNSEKYVSNGKTANGVFSYNGTKQRINKGVPAEKLVSKSGSLYFYDAKGKLLKKGIVGSSSLGYYYADKNGKINTNYCDAVKYNKKNWNVICGKATLVKTEKDKTQYRALKVIAKITNVKMTKEQKLRKCYDHLRKSYKEHNPRIPHYHGSDWTIVYANDIFVDGGGNCFSYASAFAFIAKGIGYKDVYACNSSGHGWAEINGKVYDPERSRWDKQSDFYGVSYSFGPVAHYKKAISGNESWKRVKI